MRHAGQRLERHCGPSRLFVSKFCSNLIDYTHQEAFNNGLEVFELLMIMSHVVFFKLLIDIDYLFLHYFVMGKFQTDIKFGGQCVVFYRMFYKMKSLFL